MFVGKALSLICYCYPASERGSKLAGGWNSLSPWGDWPIRLPMEKGKSTQAECVRRQSRGQEGAGELLDQGA